VAYFIGRFTAADVTPIATTPVTATRRPVGPPSPNIAPAMPSHSFEWLARFDSRRSGSSSVGVGVLTIAPYTARSIAPSSWSATAAARCEVGLASRRSARFSAGGADEVGSGAPLTC
jgi:hypothetical protein